LHHFEFQYPYVFLLLLLIICIYKCPATIQKIIFPHTHLFGKFTSFLNKDKLLYSIIFILLITSLASPILYDKKSAHDRKGRDLVFVLDTSGSMKESGFNKEEKNKTKFDILIDVISSFVQKRYDDNVGVSVFGTFAYSSVPLTYDMGAVAFLLHSLEVGIAGKNTAIGDGLNNALSLLNKGDAKSKVIILITDGFANSGLVSVKDAVLRAKEDGVKIYTIGIGKRGSFDSVLLKKVASETMAKMFETDNADTLLNIYNELNALEPSKIRSQHYLNKQMLFTYPLNLATLLLLYLLARRRL
jgi:Ca-activated chloride channel family protein